MNRKILVTGSTGLLGRSLTKALECVADEVITHGRSKQADTQFSLDDSKKCFAELNRIQPNMIINLAGQTDVDICERDINRAFLDNVVATENLVSWIEENRRDCFLIHISTDQVYDGCGPHEEEEVLIRNTYAMTKYSGELVARRVRSTILRTNFFGKSLDSDRQSFSDWILNSLRSEEKLTLFSDVLFSPLALTTLVELIVETTKCRNIGVYNLGSKQGMSKYDFGVKFANELGIDSTGIVSIKLADAGFLDARRPTDMRMDCSKFEQTFSLKLPMLANQITLAAGEYNE